MTKLFKIKNLIPVPKDGDSAVRYYLTATLATISADSDGKPKAPGSTPITFSQWKKVGNAPAALSADYNIHLFTELNGVKEYFGPTNYKSQTFGVAIQMATGKECLGADLCTDAGAVIATLGIPVNRDGKQGEDGDDGADAVIYEIVPSVGAINANDDGTVTTGAIELKVYKTEGESRSNITPVAMALGVQDPHRVQYCVDGGSSWTNCSHIGIGSGVQMKMGYGIPGSAVATVKSTLDLRLQKLKDGTYTTVYQMAPIQVVKNGAQGGRGRWYYFDGYFVSTKEYQASDAKAPYVAFDWEDTVTQNGVSTKVTRTSYYMLVASTNKASDDTLIAPRTQAASGVWELMEDNFKYMITEAIFSAFAKLGSAVFSGDWMISQYGNGGTNHNYHLFNSFDEAGWHPNIGIDFKRGEIYAGNGKVHFAKDGSGQLAGGNIKWDAAGNVEVKGKVEASSGTFNGIVKSLLAYSTPMILSNQNYNINLETGPYSNYLLLNYDGKDPSTVGVRTITLPKADTCPGVELGFFLHKETSYCHTVKVVTKHVEGEQDEDIYFNNMETDDNVFIPDMLTVASQLVLIPNNEVRIKSYHSRWYVVSGYVQSYNI